MFNLETYDCSEVFNTQMKPLLEQLQQIAIDNKINFVGIVQYLQREGANKDTMEAGISKTVALYGPARCVPSVAAAAACTDNPKGALAALIMASTMEAGTRPDDKQEMLNDGTDEELAGTRDSVESLMAHLASAKPAGKC